MSKLTKATLHVADGVKLEALGPNLLETSEALAVAILAIEAMRMKHGNDEGRSLVKAAAMLRQWKEAVASGDLGSTRGPDGDMMLPKCDDGGSPPTTGHPGRGKWVDLKMINGCGPYAYLRWREGGRCRSKYLGKADVIQT